MTLETARKINLGLMAFFGVGFFTWFVFNMQPYLAILRYDLLTNSPFAAADLSQNDILNLPLQTNTASAASQSGLELHVPKISVDAPIIKPLDTSTQGVLASLESGIGLYPDSVTLGTTGRAVVLGHSSRASWYRGNYAYVFSLLSKMQKGDVFYVTTPTQKLLYQVFDVLTLSPSDTDKLTSGPAQGSELDLVTCYPVGSASSRTVVRAQLTGTENL